MSRMSGYQAEVTSYDPVSIADGNEVALEVSVPGAKLGDFAFCSFSADVQDLQFRADVTAADTVTTVLSNSTGGNVDLAAGTLRVKVVPFDAI